MSHDSERSHEYRGPDLRRAWLSVTPFVLASTVVVAAAMIALVLQRLPHANLSLLFMIGVLIVAVRYGLWPAVYAGVFLVVAWLELYGTAIGTWEWAATIPGTGIPQGNPPSGVASGYVWFDIVALALAPFLIRSAARIRTGSRPLPDSA